MRDEENIVGLHQAYYPEMPFTASIGKPMFRDRVIPRIADETFQVMEFMLSSHTGTHVDAPSHFYPGGRTIDQYDPERFVGRALVIDARGTGEIGPEVIEDSDLSAVDWVFFCTGWGGKFRDPGMYYRSHPNIAPETAEAMRDAGISLVGIDTPTPDLPFDRRPGGYNPPVHHILLGADVLIIENLSGNLETLVGERPLVVAAPLMIVGADGAPTSVIAQM